MNRKLFIFNPNNNEPLEVDFSKTPYWNNIQQIIKNKGCTDEEYNLISCYLVKRSGNSPLVERKVLCGQEERKTIIDSLIEYKLSEKRLMDYKIVKSGIAIYLYKEYSILFFETKSKIFSFFLKKEELLNLKTNILIDILEPTKMMIYLGLVNRKIDLYNFLLKCKKKIFLFLKYELPMYLEYYDISMKFDFSEEYKKAARIKIDFNINGLDNLPFYIRYLYGKNQYKINYVIFNEFNYNFDFNQIIHFANYIYMINNMKEEIIKEDEKAKELLDIAFPKERNTFLKFLDNKLPLIELNHLVMLNKLKKHLVFKIVPRKKVINYPDNIKNITVTLKDENEEKIKKRLIDLDASQSLKVIYGLLNKANLKGVFCINESYIGKYLFLKLKSVLN
mgnify:CR=1 FL=1